VSRSLNKATLIGNVGSDPEVRSTANGGRVATFSLATSNIWNDASGTKQEKTEWHRCVAWNQGKQTLADVVERYVKKGEKVFVEGRDPVSPVAGQGRPDALHHRDQGA
jgi:single-strand DNA-binding protein